MRASGSLPSDNPFHAPGLCRRPRAGGEACYFIPPSEDVKAGFRPKSIALPHGLGEDEIAVQCRRLWQSLLEWRLNLPKGPTRYTVAWLIDRYLRDEQSPYQGLGHRALQSYAGFCKILRRDIGERRIDPDGMRQRILGEHVRTWHREWGKPAENGKPRPQRARHLIVQFRLLVTYAVELGVPGATDLRAMLSAMRFPQPPARAVAPTRQQITDLVGKALEMDRPSIAGVSLAQFELIERRAHIIGAYVGSNWRPGWTWNDISEDWTITYYQTKTGRTERVFDLKKVPALLAILQAVPKELRIGAVFKDEHSKKAWHERHYAEVFRKVADAAGWPTELKSMDLRAGGMTEADAIGNIPDRYLQDAAGHKDPRTKDRYRRDKQRNAQNVVELRQKARGVF